MGLSITDIFGGSVLGGVKDLISQFHASPEEKMKMQEMVDANAAVVQQAQIAYEEKLNDIAGQNIRSETGSSDHFTSRARPMFMYIIESILAFNYIIIPLAKIFGYAGNPIDLPTNLLTLFGVCITGYIGARSVDKLMAAPGDSSLSVGNLIKLGQKS